MITGIVRDKLLRICEHDAQVRHSPSGASGEQMSLEGRANMAHGDKEAGIPTEHSSKMSFADAMRSMDSYCQDLDYSIKNHDFEGVEHIARNAAQVWLGGLAVYGLLLQSPETRRHLETTRMNLLERFTLASRVIAVPRMRCILDELRAKLTIAAPELTATAGEPLMEADNAQPQRIQGEETQRYRIK